MTILLNLYQADVLSCMSHCLEYSATDEQEHVEGMCHSQGLFPLQAPTTDASIIILFFHRHDMELRMTERRKEEVAHQILIQESYQESQDRHAYRLAHPAYADGRIW